MTTCLLHRVVNDPPMTVMERGIMTATSYFLDQKFLVSVDGQFPAGQQLVPNVPAPLPANWRNNIVNSNQDYNNAHYFIRKRNQTFFLEFMYSRYTETVRASVKVSS